MGRIIDFILYLTLRLLVALVNSFPLSFRRRALAIIIGAFMRLIPSQRRVAMRNLEQVFPGDKVKQEEVLRKHHYELARLIIDAIRLHKLNGSWVERNADLTCVSEVQRLRERFKGRGVIYASGHLGSFELLAFLAPFLGRPCAVVVRPFKSHYIWQWLTTTRKQSGNDLIERNGASREMIRRLRSDGDIALLFDQNVKRKHAIFIEWFRRPAATTRSVALATIETGAPILVAALFPQVGQDKYKMELYYCDVEDILNSTDLSLQEKVEQITFRISTKLQEYILRYPEGWFWYHRRWRTTPNDNDENFYG